MPTINNHCSTHRDNPTTDRCRTCNRIRDERRVARCAIRDLTSAGFLLSVNDGYETTVERETSANRLIAAMFTTDEDILIAEDRQGQRVGMVYFVWGNSGSDCINDYSVRLEPHLTATMGLMDRMA